MEKPFNLIHQEMKQEFVDVANKYSSQIPASVIVDVLQNLTLQIDSIAQTQLQQAKVEYSKSLEEDKNGE